MKMLTVKKEMSYDEYAALRREIFKNISFGVVNAEFINDYPGKRGMAYFQFWDLKYVPECLKPYLLHIPGNFQKKMELEKNITEQFLKFNPETKTIGDLKLISGHDGKLKTFDSIFDDSTKQIFKDKYGLEEK